MPRSDDDFAREIEAHISFETDRLIEQGLPADEADAAARRRFGNVTRTREHFHEARRTMWLDDLRQDAAYALRSLAATRVGAGRSPWLPRPAARRHRG